MNKKLLLSALDLCDREKLIELIVFLPFCEKSIELSIADESLDQAKRTIFDQINLLDEFEVEKVFEKIANSVALRHFLLNNNVNSKVKPTTDLSQEEIEVLSIRLDDFEKSLLDRRIINAFKIYSEDEGVNISYMYQLVQLSKSKVFTLRNIGDGSADKIKNSIKYHRLEFSTGFSIYDLCKIQSNIIKNLGKNHEVSQFRGFIFKFTFYLYCKVDPFPYKLP